MTGSNPVTPLLVTPAGRRLNKVLQPYCRLAIAFSGGVDSTLLARAAALALGPDNVLLVHLASPLNKAAETVTAMQWAKDAGLPLRVIRLDPRRHPDVRRNAPRRCYFCKQLIMAAVRAEAEPLGFAVLADGANLDDLNDYRPGMQAADEAGVQHPLIAAKMTKAAIRRLAKQLAVHNWNAPAAACLASRLRYGAELTDDALARVDQAETYLESLGFRGCRVRDFDGRADLEVLPSLFRQVLKLRVEITDKLRHFGFRAVSLNLEGYRQGAMNAELGPAGRKTAS